jgi:formylglycine-generating enzyme required for sulfatase activity
VTCLQELPLAALGFWTVVSLAAVNHGCKPGVLGAHGSDAVDVEPPPVEVRAEAGDAAPSARPVASSARPVAAPPSAADNPALPRRPDEMLLVPAGELIMGSDEGGEQDEHPAHPVRIEAFYLDETEVTNEAYGRAVAAGIVQPPNPENAKRNGFGSDRRFRKPQQPVSAISWHDARAYCGWLGKRLPSEAEWERAARGDDARQFPWGDEKPDRERAQFSTSITAEVGAHPAGAGPYGHLDLAGNVWEWVEDVYDPFAYRRPGASRGGAGSCEESLAAFDQLRRNGQRGFTGANPIPTECERVLRGGAFNYPPAGLRASNRVHHPPRFRLVMSGFRCAADP